MSLIACNPYIAAPPFHPGLISGCKAFLDARYRGTTTNRWDDLSGNNNHFNSPAAGNFPSFSGGEATFDGNSDYLDSPASMMSGSTAGEIFIRQKRYADNGDATTNSGWMDFGSDASLQDHFTYSSSIYSGFGSNARKTVGDPSLATNVYHTIDIWSASADWSLTMNSTVIYSTGTNTVGWIATAKLGASKALGTYFQGTIKAMAVYNRKLTAEERANVKDYFGAL